MTTSPLPSRSVYQGTIAGTNGPFPLATTGGTAIPVMDATEVRAIKYPAAGGSAVLSQAGSPPDYTVTLTPIVLGGVTYQSAYVTATVALTAGDVLAVERVTPLQQTFNPAQGGALFHASMEGAWDRLTRIAQEHRDALDRAILADDGWDGVTLTGPATMNARGLRIADLAPAEDPGDAVNFSQLGTGGSAGQAAAALAVTMQSVTPVPATPLVADLSKGYYIQLHLDSTIPDLSFTNWAPAGQVTKITLEIIQAGSMGITAWPTFIDWNGGLPPSLDGTPGAVNLAVIISSDGGSTAIGSAW
jgi:hypothetical protein